MELRAPTCCSHSTRAAVSTASCFVWGFSRQISSRMEDTTDKLALIDSISFGASLSEPTNSWLDIFGVSNLLILQGSREPQRFPQFTVCSRYLPAVLPERLQQWRPKQPTDRPFFETSMTNVRIDSWQQSGPSSSGLWSGFHATWQSHLAAWSDTGTIYNYFWAWRCKACVFGKTKVHRTSEAWVLRSITYLPYRQRILHYYSFLSRAS